MQQQQTLENRQVIGEKELVNLDRSPISFDDRSQMMQIEDEYQFTSSQIIF